MKTAARAIATSRWKWWIGGALLVLTLSCAGSFWVYANRCVTVDRLEAEIKTSMRPGSTREEVEAWLNAHGIDRHWYVEHGTPEDFHEQNPWRAGTGTGAAGAVVGFFPAGRNCLTAAIDLGNIYVLFFFDKEGKLSSHLVIGDHLML
jgi:hypothetical protein